MTTIELNTKDLQNINGGTKQGYNNGREIGQKAREFLINAALVYIGSISYFNLF